MVTPLGGETLPSFFFCKVKEYYLKNKIICEFSLSFINSRYDFEEELLVNEQKKSHRYRTMGT